MGVSPVSVFIIYGSNVCGKQEQSSIAIARILHRNRQDANLQPFANALAISPAVPRKVAPDPLDDVLQCHDVIIGRTANSVEQIVTQRGSEKAAGRNMVSGVALQGCLDVAWDHGDCFSLSFVCLSAK